MIHKFNRIVLPITFLYDKMSSIQSKTIASRKNNYVRKKMNIKNLCKLIDERQDELISLLCSLIKINSENFRHYGNEREIAEYIYALCRGLGLESEVYSPMDIKGFADHPDFMPGRHLEDRFNVTAIWRGKEDKDGLMLMAHHDTVEIGDYANWSRDPLSGEFSDGKIHGRGACDDKYAIASALFLIKLLRDAGVVPKKNILFTAYCDEEHGGSHGALATVLRYPTEVTLSLDGRQREVWHCASGGCGLRYTYRSTDIVNSAEKVASAIPVILEEINRFGERRKAELAANPFYKGTIIPEMSHRYMGIQAGNNGIDLGIGRIDFTYYTDKSREEIGSELSELEARLNERLAPLGLVGDGFSKKTRFFHYAYCRPDDENIGMLLSAAKEATGAAPNVCGSCLSDLSIIAKYSKGAAFGYGMGRDFGEAGGAHQPNEFIELSDLIEYTKNLGAYILKLMG